LDELPPQTRRVLSLLDAWVTAECEELACERSDYRFTTREVREALGLGQTQTKIHLARLVELEYLLTHRAVPGRPHVYELVYAGEGEGGRAFLPGLLDPTELGEYDKKRSGRKGDRSGLEAERSGPGRPLDGPRSGEGRTALRLGNPADGNGLRRTPPDSPPPAYVEDARESYVGVHRNGVHP
jgi:hypothetical protein